jgi:hypothetical protein
LRGDALTVVDDREDDDIPIRIDLDPDLDRTTGRREAKSIADEIREHLPDLVLFRPHDGLESWPHGFGQGHRFAGIACLP